MAHRALVAYRRADGYTLHYAHWGAGLAEAITAATPWGGAVEPRPVGHALSAEHVCAALTPAIESLVVVGPTFATQTYLVCSLAVDGGPPLVLAGPTDDSQALRAWFVEEKSRLVDRIQQQTLSPSLARRVLRRKLARRTAVHSPDDASFLRTD